MCHQVPAYYRTVSERLSNILDDIGYSKEDRDRKVMYANGWEVFNNIHQSGLLMKQYMVGSRGEGSTGPGLHSDRDVLLQSDRLNMTPDLSDFHLGKVNLLMVQDKWTHPGYVKLQTVTTLRGKTHVPIYHYQTQILRADSYGRTVLSNKVNNVILGVTPTGPAIRRKLLLMELSSDNVFAIRCTTWPIEAHEWFLRRRSHRWQNSHHIRNANKDGCFAVAIGHPQSHEEDLEWRLSFSITERNLTRSFEDTVMKVYILLKMIRITYIEPFVGDAFSSYHCKVCMLWMREKTPPELWCTENLLYCLDLCIKQLYEWVTMGYCPDYFIVTNNIYDSKLFGVAQSILTRILGFLVSEDCRFLLGLECCNLGQLLLSDCSNLDIIHSLKDIDSVRYLEALADSYCIVTSAVECRTSMLRDIPQEYNNLTSCIIRMTHALQHAPRTLRIYLDYIIKTLLSRLGFYVASVCKENVQSLSQVEIDHLMGLASKCLTLGINSDATSVRLKLCGLGTMLGYYDMAEVSLQHICDQSFSCMFSGTPGKVYVSKCNVDLHTEALLTRRYSIMELLQNQLSCYVVYLPSETSITPIALRMEMFRSIGAPTVLRDDQNHFWYDWAVVDSIMCLYFFQYLNFFRPGKERHQQAAIENMKHVIITDPQIRHKDTRLNLLGYSFVRGAQFRNAFGCFYESLTSCPHNNAAKFYLGILFRKVHAARRRGERN